MQLIFIYGEAASGKLTVARELAARTGFALFHNHLVVDALAAVFPFGSDMFVELRERFWLDVFRAAVGEGRSLIFTFAPEASVAPDFPERVRQLIQDTGGQLVFVALTVGAEEQERRLVESDRAHFGKLRSVDLLRQLNDQFRACMAAMPPADITIDTEKTSPSEAARLIAENVGQIEPDAG